MTVGDPVTAATTGTPSALVAWTAALAGLVVIVLGTHRWLRPGPKLFGPVRDRWLPFGPLDLVAALLLMIVVGSLAMRSAIAALRLAAGDDAGSDPDGVIELSQVLLGQAVAQIPVALYFLARVVSWRELAAGPRGDGTTLTAVTVRGLAWGATMFVAILILSGFCLEVASQFGMPRPESGHRMLDILADTGHPLVTVGVMLSALLFAPVLEETIYRGVIQTSFASITGRQRGAAIVITSFLFSAHHVAGVPLPLLPGIFLLSVILGWLYERNGNLLAPILAHATFNGLNLLVSSAAR